MIFNKAAIRIFLTVVFLPVFSLRTEAEEFTNALHTYLQHTVDTVGPNGCVVVGLVDERGSEVVSYGKLDNGTARQADGDTLFAIHSATSSFTRLLLLDMVHRGEMKLDDPVAEYLPESVKIPTFEGKQITLRDLDRQSCGLPDFMDQLDPKRADDAMADFTVEKMDAFVSGCRLTTAPGTRYFHGGVDYGLLAQAMALKAGMDYESLEADRVFRPLKMNSTRFSLTPEIQSRVASRHDSSGFGYATPEYNRGALAALAGLYSTANDLLKCVSADLGLMPSSLTPLMENAVDVVYFPQPHAPGVLHSGGGGVGGHAVISFDKARRRGAVVLNTSYFNGQDLLAFLLQCEWQSDHRPMATNIDSRVYDSYVGQYRQESSSASHGFKPWPFSNREVDTNSHSGVAIRREGDRIFAQATGSVPLDDLLLWPPEAVELLPETETQFFERLSARTVTFNRDHRSRVIGLTLSYQGKSFSYQKISDLPPKVPELPKTPVVIALDSRLLDACVGLYEFPPGAVIPAGMKMTIRRDGNKLVGQGSVWDGHLWKSDFDIYPESETEFFDRYMYSQYTFVKNSKGEVDAVIRHHPGDPDCVGKKLRDPSIQPVTNSTGR